MPKLFKRVGILFALLFFIHTTAVFAEVTPEGYYRSVLDRNADNYITPYGNEQFPRNEDNGIKLTVIEQSVSPMWVNLEVVVGTGTQTTRHISKFYILGNGKIIDYFYPQLYDANDDGVADQFREQYIVKPTFLEAIGSQVYFTIIGVQADPNDEYEYIVAWSKPSETIQFDPLPVADNETHTWLENILYALQALLAKLNELLDTLASKLDSLKKAVEDIYTPRPETMQAFNQALDNLMDKMPFNELQESASQITESYNRARQNLQQPGSKIGFGGQFCFIPGVSESCVENILDLTEFRETVLLLREIMRAFLWLFFFHFLFMWMRPKMRF